MQMHTAVRRGFLQTFDWWGRASRSEFWWFLLASALFYFACLAIAAALENPFVLLVWAVPFIPATLAIGARRLHDTDRSAAWLLLLLIPYGVIALLILCCGHGTPGPNRFGPPSEPAPVAEGCRRLAWEYTKQGHILVAAGHTALAVVYGGEAGQDVGEDLTLLADQRAVLGDRAFRLRLYEVLDGPGADDLYEAVKARGRREEGDPGERESSSPPTRG
ncbi:DUF805 domain-containing protein [Actinomadura rugatobispora]|uniref:DUF805 domain-containing protein n=1 Tax=Actinomadura rugatobispora TaxID=1994 RepID=A0ABW1A151_9ACTN|nr:hypothetical protein GCM10010200_037900 [Actinomadura rugatobispora]